MIPSYKNILVGTDLSKSADAALLHAIALAKNLGARIHLLHVCEALSDDAKVTLMMFMQDEKARAEALSRRFELINAALKNNQENFWRKLPEKDQELRALIESTEVVEGFPADILLQVAKSKACDLLVLGAHEHGFNHTFLGSVAKRVMRRAEIPTLVVPNRLTE